MSWYLAISIIATIALIMAIVLLFITIKNIKDDVYNAEKTIEVPKMGGFWDKLTHKKDRVQEEEWKKKLDEQAKAEAMSSAEAEYKTKRVQEEKDRLLGKNKTGFVDKLAKGFNVDQSGEKVGRALGGGQTLRQLASDEKIDRMLGKTSYTPQEGRKFVQQQQSRPFNNMPSFTDEINIKSVPNVNVGRHVREDVEIYQTVKNAKPANIKGKPTLDYRRVNVQPESVKGFDKRLKRGM